MPVRGPEIKRRFLDMPSGLGASCACVRELSSSGVQAAVAAAGELVERRIHVAEELVVLIKGICEASEGLCAMFAERGGDLLLSAPRSRERELDELVADFRNDFGAALGNSE